MFPRHVVDIDCCARGVQVEDPVDSLFNKGDIVGNYDDPSWVGTKERTKPGHRVGVEVVGGFVKNHERSILKQNAGQLDASPLSTRQCPERLLKNPWRQVKV